MSAKSREFLKRLFRKSYFYNEERRKEFEDFIDSFWNTTDDGSPALPYKRFNAILSQVGGGTDATIVFINAYNGNEYQDAFSLCPVEIRVWP